MTIKSWVRITPDAIVSDRPVPVAEGSGKDMLVSAFRALGCGYAKFHKMDTLSKAGFLASEILLSDELGRFEPREDRAVLLFNSSASLCDDRHYQNTINDPQNWFPSPAVFGLYLAEYSDRRDCHTQQILRRDLFLCHGKA